MMRTFAWIVGLLGICIYVGGCTYSAGPWSGHDEQIRDYKAVPVQSTPVAAKPVIEPMPPENVTENVAVVEPEEVVNLETEPSQANDAQGSTTSNVSTSESVIETIATISKIDSNSTKRRYYLAIAKRDNLDDKGQVALVNAVFDNLFSDSAMEEVLIALTQNPRFGDAGRDAITSRSDDFFSDSSKKRILSALGSE